MTPRFERKLREQGIYFDISVCPKSPEKFKKYFHNIGLCPFETQLVTTSESEKSSLAMSEFDKN